MEKKKNKWKRRKKVKSRLFSPPCSMWMTEQPVASWNWQWIKCFRPLTIDVIYFATLPYIYTHTQTVWHSLESNVGPPLPSPYLYIRYCMWWTWTDIMDCRACSPASESRRLHELLYLSLSVFFVFFSFFFHGELKKRCARRMAHESSLSSLTALFFLFAILYWPIIAVRNANVGQQRTASNSAIRG